MSMEMAEDELLMAYAAGSLPEPLSLVVATHLALSPRNRELVRSYEAYAGLLFDEIEPAPVSEDSLDRLLDRLDNNPTSRDDMAQPTRMLGDPCLPRPLRDYLPGTLNSLVWTRYGSVAEVELLSEVPGYRTRLLKIKAGKAVPKHTHGGNEVTVVIEGAFRDGAARYGRGDMVSADGSIDHQPIAEDGMDCLCLAVTDAPLKLTGRFTRLLNPFIRI